MATTSQPGVETPPLLRVVVFSKDRPLQADAALRSLRGCCADPERLDVRVLYAAGTPRLEALYSTAAQELPWAAFEREDGGFKAALLRLASGARHLAFVVDDAIFVRSWRASDVVAALDRCPEALGVSLRLGRNTTSCYSFRREQPVPPLLEVGHGLLALDWTSAELDFGYPLELSSSVYRGEDVLPMLRDLGYANPNQLEDRLHTARQRFASARPVLLCAERSVAFCVPLNVVQREFPNRGGDRPDRSVDALASAYAEGRRVRVEALRSHTPRACHEEVELPLEPAATPAGDELARWKALGAPIPPPHDVKAAAILRLAREHGARVLVETGTYQGDMVAATLDAFDAIHTIELDASLHAAAARRFASAPHVRCLQGDSGRVLPQILSSLGEPALFWLDGHWSGGMTARGDLDTPVLEELRHVLAHPVRGHVLLVDDARLFGTDPAYPAASEIVERIRRAWPDHDVEIAADAIRAIPRRAAMEQARSSARPALPHDPERAVAILRGAAGPGNALRLHLGCGERPLPGYVNVDLAPTPADLMRTGADVLAHIPDMRLPRESVDEIRLHHVFEHFGRVMALALLVRWHEWLRPGGRLVIETPDLAGSARTLLSDEPLATKLGVVRHLAGDQAAPWAYHVDHWFPERFRHALHAMGFADVQVQASRWERPPFLSNVTAVAEKRSTLPRAQLLARADLLLATATVAPDETALLARWRTQLREELDRRPSPAASPAAERPASAEPISAWLGGRGTGGPLAEILDYNQRDRDRWVAARAAEVPRGSRVLDVGAGTCPYRRLFAHCDYVAHDFKRYEGVKLGGGREYAAIDLVSDATAIPVAPGSFDVALCTEVLEHVPDPAAVVAELSRVVQPGGRILLTAPLGSGLHQLPFHYFGGFSPEWYREQARRTGLAVTAITPNGGFFKLLAQETGRAASILAERAPSAAPVLPLLAELLPRFFHALDEDVFVDQFTAGYFVELARLPAAVRS
jgi:SAM-dependent methyltransferase